MQQFTPIVFTVAIAFAFDANAQASSTPPAWMTGGYGGAGMAVNRQFDPGTRDSNGNRVIVNGEIQEAGLQSVVSQFTSLSGGAGAAVSASESGAAIAIGGSLDVQPYGSWNTVIVNATQVNSGTVTVQVSVNGKRNANASH